MPLQFDWENLWAFHEGAMPDIQEHIENEVIGGGWLFRQSAKDQKRILAHAPETFVKQVASRLKPELATELGHNPYASIDYSNLLKQERTERKP